MHRISTKLCVFFRNLCKSVISPLSKSYISGSIEVNCISLSNEFCAKVFRSLVERKVKNWKSSFRFCCYGGNLTSFLETNRLMSTIQPFVLGAHTGQPVWNSLWIRPCWWHWKEIQTLKKNCFFIWKMTWGIWWTLTWAEICTFVGYFCRKYVVFQLEKYRGVVLWKMI